VEESQKKGWESEHALAADSEAFREVFPTERGEGRCEWTVSHVLVDHHGPDRALVRQRGMALKCLQVELQVSVAVAVHDAHGHVSLHENTR